VCVYARGVFSSCYYVNRFMCVCVCVCVYDVEIDVEILRS
jgi:hypothetical protein